MKHGLSQKWGGYDGWFILVPTGETRWKSRHTKMYHAWIVALGDAGGNRCDGQTRPSPRKLHIGPTNH